MGDGNKTEWKASRSSGEGRRMKRGQAKDSPYHQEFLAKARIRLREYRAKNPEKTKEWARKSGKRHYQKYREQILANYKVPHKGEKRYEARLRANNKWRNKKRKIDAEWRIATNKKAMDNYYANHERRREQARASWPLRRQKQILHMKEYRHRVKQECLEHYGGVPPRCACCGEGIRPFLTMDHIDGNGTQHRRQLRLTGHTTTFYLWLKSAGYPEGYRVLCYNCNSGRELNGGICPHQQRLAEIWR
jgi:hypothetical protein